MDQARTNLNNWHFKLVSKFIDFSALFLCSLHFFATENAKETLYFTHRRTYPWHRISGVEFKTMSAVNLTAMAHAVDAHDANFIRYFINDPVVAHADAPVVFTADQFATAGRTRMGCKPLDSGDNTAVNLGRQLGEILLRGAFEQNSIRGHPRLRWARYSSNGR